MVSVSNNLALCSGVIDLRSIVEGVRVAERCFPAAQLAAKAPLQRRQESGKRCTASSLEVWVLVGAVWRGSGDSGKEQHLEHVPRSALMAAAAEVTAAVVVARQHRCIF